MRTYFLWILLPLLLLLNLADLPVSRSTCPSRCGEIDIPHPFGIGEGCYLNSWYEIKCNLNASLSASKKPVPVLSVIDKEVVKITPPYSIRIKHSIASKGCSSDGEEELESLLNLTGTPFYLGPMNTLIAAGCGITATLTNVEPSIAGCKSRCGKKNHTPTQDFLALDECITDYSADAEFCRKRSIADEKRCSGIGCCEASIRSGRQQIVGVRIDNTTTTGGCKVAFLTDEDYLLSNGADAQRIHSKGNATVSLGWLISTSNPSFFDSLGCHTTKEYRQASENQYGIPYGMNCTCDNYSSFSTYGICDCTRGYRGDPYVVGGCKDINECLEGKDENGNPVSCASGTCVNLQGGYTCVYENQRRRVIAIGVGSSFGSLIFVAGIYLAYRFIRKQRRLNQKKKFFKRNGGLLLQQQLTSTQGNVETTKVFTSKELEKATENFSLNRILGQGGQGTVYKGMLVDGRIVAVKKSKVVDEDKLEEFINEVVILSQINHRNIVKLLGCCLETHVPVLVYEFIPNGNLFEHLHDEFGDIMMATWELRLRIAIDVAGSLSYLHSSASFPIYHRDVKSTNIMLDEKYRAKVSDFGTSRSVTVDHTHLTTVVSGTAGYMDPEYFQSSQFTDKSDVYSFGVVLVELITGEKPFSFLRSQENRTLSSYFTLAMKEDKLFDIIDPRIRDGCNLNQVTAAADIARTCLNMKRKKRPSMREVSMELEKIRGSSEDMQSHEYVAEVKEDKNKSVVEVNIGECSWTNVAVTAPASQNSVATSSLSDTEPLFPLQTRSPSCVIKDLVSQLSRQIINFSMVFWLAQNINSSTSSCNRTCGGISIPFPFGIGQKHCYLNDWYEVVCNTTTTSSGNLLAPFLSKINRELVTITLRNSIDTSYGVVHIKSPVSKLCNKGSRFSTFEADNQLFDGVLACPSLMTTAQNINSSTSSCNRTCGGISIPFPFGIGQKHCYLNDWYEVVCNTTTTSSGNLLAPFLSKINRELVTITLRNSIDTSYGVVHIKSPVTSSGCSQQPAVKPPPLNPTGKGSPFFITETNRLVSVGCDARALVTNIESQIIGCESSCDGRDNKNKSRSDKICGGYRCCQAVITADKPQVIGVNLESSDGGDCKVAFLTNETYSPANVTEAEEVYSKGFSVVELGWFFDSRLRDPVGCVNLTETGIYTSAPSCVCEYGYFSGFGYSNCYCNNIGYRGNPYLPGGCVDIDECEEGKGRNSCGEQTCVNVPGSFRCEPKESGKIKPVIQGLILGLVLLFLVLGIWGLIKFVKKRRKIIQKRKFFKRNGGLLLKQQLTTQEGGNVETSKIFTSKELEKATDSFNKNRVLGQGGQDLFKRLHDDSDDYIMTWEVRLRIAGEIAGALAYLHSAASTPVYHRDIKTTNILLDEKYRAKVSDFGTSRSINIDQTHLTTLVAGTFGYLDPEYFQTSQFTDKSDVYSFGVVLVELITGEKPFSVMRSEENRGLASHFNEAMKENRVLDIVDSRIKEECKQEQVLAVAKLARRCLSLKGKKRPNMREVSIELERIRSSPEDL
ncbi:hypothetical protein F2Q69_00051890 [Brassica cretica]|uniref:Protein kinase domain-containing protein n=1 Tax=Brassica cretica TaxID=69181 RepID=A0A8S9PY69_BRACR|nr:hypothetical protein F2Q69_00051890 [Brassica cretica]